MVTKPHEHRHKAELVCEPILIHIRARGRHWFSRKTKQENKNKNKTSLAWVCSGPCTAGVESSAGQGHVDRPIRAALHLAEDSLWPAFRACGRKEGKREPRAPLWAHYLMFKGRAGPNALKGLFQCSLCSHTFSVCTQLLPHSQISLWLPLLWNLFSFFWSLLHVSGIDQILSVSHPCYWLLIPFRSWKDTSAID